MAMKTPPTRSKSGVGGGFDPFADKRIPGVPNIVTNFKDEVASRVEKAAQDRAVPAPVRIPPTADEAGVARAFRQVLANRVAANEATTARQDANVAAQQQMQTSQGRTDMLLPQAVDVNPGIRTGASNLLYGERQVGAMENRNLMVDQVNAGLRRILPGRTADGVAGVEGGGRIAPFTEEQFRQATTPSVPTAPPQEVIDAAQAKLKAAGPAPALPSDVQAEMRARQERYASGEGKAEQRRMGRNFFGTDTTAPSARGATADAISSMPHGEAREAAAAAARRARMEGGDPLEAVDAVVAKAEAEKRKAMESNMTPEQKLTMAKVDETYANMEANKLKTDAQIKEYEAQAQEHLAKAKALLDGGVTDVGMTAMFNGYNSVNKAIASFEGSDWDETTKARYEELIKVKTKYENALREAGHPMFQDKQDDGGDTATPSNVEVAVPQAGEVQDGYRFNGGDPSNPNNWTPING